MDLQPSRGEALARVVGIGPFEKQPTHNLGGGERYFNDKRSGYVVNRNVMIGALYLINTDKHGHNLSCH